MDNFDLSLYLVTDSSLLPAGSTLESVVAEAVKGGVTIVQLREKELAFDDFVERARAIKKITDRYNVPLIINDDIDVALTVDAAGIHIGQSDSCYEEARRRLGADKIIGLSVETIEQAVEANSFEVDYIAISPIFNTSTKGDISTPLGIDGALKIVAASKHPVVAIGGINGENIPDVMGCGVDGVALVSAIISAKNPFLSAQNLRAKVEDSRPKWSDVAWRVSMPLFERIKNQQFNQEMMSGKLPQEVFKRYIEQDIIYIANYSEEMLLIAKMLTVGSQRAQFEEFACDGMAAEKALHEMIVKKWGGVSHDVKVSQVTLDYIMHTRKWVDAQDVELSVAAILPCIWVYGEIGRYLYNNSSLGQNPYREWIETYYSDLMQSGVQLSIELSNSLAINTTAKKRAMMRHEFVKAVWFEWAFWGWAYDKGCYLFENEDFNRYEI